MTEKAFKKYSGHAKRVTLSLARCSHICAQYPELMEILQKLPHLRYDLERLEQEELELIYAEFDEELEEKIRSEFVADPTYLIDLGIANGTCPLCGHEGCRWIFKLENTKGGESIECGSECIITYGLSVMGAETAEAAKKMLEKAIRQRQKELRLAEWHKEYNFTEEYFDTVRDGLHRIRFDTTAHDYTVRSEATELMYKALPRLQKFYEKNGWLGTLQRWESWRSLVTWVRANDELANDELPQFKPFEKKKPQPKVAKEEPKPKPVKGTLEGQMSLFGGTDG